MNDNNITIEEKIESNDVEQALPPIPSESDDMIEMADHVSEKFQLEQQDFNDDKEIERLWKARTGLDYDSLCGAIETIIFMSDKPISLKKIKILIDEEMPLRVIFESITRLQEEYELKHHGLRLVEVADGYQFRTKATYSKFVQDIFKVNSLVLTPSTLESLAVIAYKQPVSRIELDKIRGVDSSHLIRGLMERRLVKIVGRSEDVGRPVLYGTTPEFLEVFSLNSLEDLPPERELEELSKKDVAGIGDIRKIVKLGDKSRFVFDETQELEKLSLDIKDISSDTIFTKSLKIEEKKKFKSIDGQVIKSAFDIIEEFIWKDEVVKTNQSSILSESMSSYVDPTVISDLSAGPFNLPDVADEDFQMIDLESGDIIDEDSEIEVEVELELDDSENLFMANYKEDEFEKLLDSNFENIMGEKLPTWNELSSDEVDEITLKEDQISEKIEQINLQAEKLDINLSLD